MTISRYRYGVVVVVLALAACGHEQPNDDPRIAQLQSRVDELERKLQENAAKDDRVYNVLKGEMMARRQAPVQRESRYGMADFLQEMERSKTDRRLDELESREFLRSQGAQR